MSSTVSYYGQTFVTVGKGVVTVGEIVVTLGEGVVTVGEGVVTVSEGIVTVGDTEFSKPQVSPLESSLTNKESPPAPKLLVYPGII